MITKYEIEQKFYKIKSVEECGEFTNWLYSQQEIPRGLYNPFVIAVNELREQLTHTKLKTEI